MFKIFFKTAVDRVID